MSTTVNQEYKVKAKRLGKKVPTKFTWEPLTYKLAKHPINPEGTIETRVNYRTMARKAFKAYLNGKRFYRYKGQIFVVPQMSLKAYNESIAAQQNQKINEDIEDAEIITENIVENIDDTSLGEVMPTPSLPEGDSKLESPSEIVDDTTIPSSF